MATSIDIKIRQDFLRLKPLAVPPETDEDGVFFLSEIDKKPKYRAPNNGMIYTLNLTEYRVKELVFASNGDTNGLMHYIGSRFGQQAWSLPTTEFVYINNSSDQPDSRSIGPYQLISRQEGFYSTYDYPDSQLGIQLNTPESILLKGVYVRAANIPDYGFPINWRVSAVNFRREQSQIIFEVLNSDILNGINKEVYIPISSVDEGVSMILISQTGTNSINTNHLCLGQIELYGLFK